MPQTPSVKFKFENLNVQASVPLLGVTNVVARTTKGPFEDPSTIISTPTQFERVFGSEIVPDGSVSNIIQALKLGSKLRISRVAGTGATYGWAVPMSVTANAAIVEYAVPSITVPASSSIIMLKIDAGDGNVLSIPMAIRTREAGSPVIDNIGVDLNRPFYLKINYASEPSVKASLAQYASVDSTNAPVPESLLAETPLFNAVVEGNSPTMDVNMFVNFIENAPNITLEVVKGKVTGTGSFADYATGVQTNEDVISALRQFSNNVVNIFVGTLTAQGEVGAVNEITDANRYMSITEGNAGAYTDDQAGVDAWVSAYKASKEYYEAYQIILSSVHQHLPSNYTKVYISVADDVHNIFEQMLYVEVPKYAPGTRIPATPEETLSALRTLVQAIGPKKEVAYFGGGIKYYNENGSLQKCDLLGSVVGLADASASNFGPWYSFSGMNRGVIADAIGPVMVNLGGPGKVETLQSLADWYMNLFVIKDTRTMGKRTMLWHGFTSNPINNSEKFISIVRLNLYLKKNLRPILESFIEEPNTFESWKRIYNIAKDDVLDDLVNRNAMTSYTWIGDQDATSYDELQINNEADVRQGIYKAQLRYREVVPMQNIEMEVVIDVAVNRATGEISITPAA